MILKQFHRTADAGERGLELVADRVGKVAEIARTTLDRRRHHREIGVEALDLDRRGRWRIGDAPASARDCARRRAELLDRARDAAGNDAAEHHEQPEDRSDPQRYLAAVFIQSPEQRTGGTRQQEHADHAVADDDRACVMDAYRCGSGQPFEAVGRAVCAVAAEDGRGAAGQCSGNFGECGVAADGRTPGDNAAVAIEEDDRGQRGGPRRVHDRRKTRGGGHRIGEWSRADRNRWPLRADRRRAEVDARCGRLHAIRVVPA